MSPGGSVSIQEACAGYLRKCGDSHWWMESGEQAWAEGVITIWYRPISFGSPWPGIPPFTPLLQLFSQWLCYSSLQGGADTLEHSFPQLGLAWKRDSQLQASVDGSPSSWNSWATGLSQKMGSQGVVSPHQQHEILMGRTGICRSAKVLLCKKISLLGIQFSIRVY